MLIPANKVDGETKTPVYIVAFLGQDTGLVRAVCINRLTNAFDVFNLLDLEYAPMSGPFQEMVDNKISDMLSKESEVIKSQQTKGGHNAGKSKR